MNLNLNSLLVARQMTIFQQGARIELAIGPTHKRNVQLSGKQRVNGVIPVSESLGERIYTYRPLY